MNARGDATVTGIVLSDAPYIAVFDAGAVGLIALASARRRNVTEEN